MLSSRAGTPLMLLVLVSDGVPYEQGYERIYALADTRQALREAVARGIGCACVSVRASTEAAFLEKHLGRCPVPAVGGRRGARGTRPASVSRGDAGGEGASRRPGTSRMATRERYPVAPTRRELAVRAS